VSGKSSHQISAKEKETYPVSEKSKPTSQPVSNNQKETYLAISENQKEDYSEGNANKSIWKKNLKKSHFNLHPVSQNPLFLKIFSVMGVDESNLEEKLPLIEQKLKEGLELVQQQKYAKARFKIVYLLKELRFASFNQIQQHIGLNPRILKKILDDLNYNWSIVKQNDTRLKIAVNKHNNMLHWIKESRKRSFYSLNEDNDKVFKYKEEVNSFVDNSFKKDVKEEKLFYEDTLNQYDEYIKTKEERRKTTLNKIRTALSEVGEQQEFIGGNQLREFLIYDRELIGKTRFKEFKKLLINRGMLEEVQKDGKFMLRITEKMSLDYQEDEN